MQKASMVALQIRDVPEDVRRSLAARAAAWGQSLQSYLLALVTEESRRATNLALLDRFRAREDGSRLSSSGVLDALDEARAERARHLDEVVARTP